MAGKSIGCFNNLLQILTHTPGCEVIAEEITFLGRVREGRACAFLTWTSYALLRRVVCNVGYIRFSQNCPKCASAKFWNGDIDAKSLIES
jgi:hypothetical protein